MLQVLYKVWSLDKWVFEILDFGYSFANFVEKNFFSTNLQKNLLTLWENKLSGISCYISLHACLWLCIGLCQHPLWGVCIWTSNRTHTYHCNSNRTHTYHYKSTPISRINSISALEGKHTTYEVFLSMLYSTSVVF